MKKLRKLTLPENFIYTLVKLPESGFGYRVVKVSLKDGKVLNKLKVINSEFLLLDEEEITVNDIENIELDYIK